MKEESAFRSTAAALFVAAASISVYYRHRAERAGKDEISSLEEEGLPTAIALRSSGFALMLSVMAYVLNPRWMRWSSLALPSWLRWSGTGLGAASLPLAYWVFHTLGRNITPTVETREEHELVTGGPYRSLGEASPVYGRELVLRLAEPCGGELVYGFGQRRGARDAPGPAAEGRGEADRALRRRIPRLHEANRTAAAAHQAKRRVAPPSSPLVSGARVLRGCKPPFRFLLRREEESRPLY